MEHYTVSQMEKDTHWEGFLLVRSADIRRDKKGNDYLDMNLSDKTGEINSKYWNRDAVRTAPKAGNVIRVSGMVQEFNGRLQLRVDSYQPVTPEDDVDMNTLVPSAPRKPADMLREIQETVSGFQNEGIRKLTLEMLETAGEKLEWFPAAQRMHHAERSGLLHHTTDMLALAKGIVRVYPWLNSDLLYAGVILHDLGKIDELQSDPNGNVADYTPEGQMLGHLVGGIVNLNRAADKAGVHGETLLLLEHMLLSHHGETDYGSPKAPMFPEAEALHWLDMMDARMNTMKGVVDMTPAGAFSEKIFSLDRRVYHPRYSDDAE